MSAAGSSEEQFLCSICLEVFSEPVSTPCGHNFCKRCISETWDTKAVCKCPLCNKSFSIRPELCVNTFISEMISQFKREAELQSKKVSKPVDVQCDVCSEPKLKAVKSCLVCLSSFCESHLHPHLTVSGLKRHQLMEPVDDLEDRMCPTHQRPLELFCNTDQSCVCTMCVLLEHKNHEYVSLEEACERRRSSLQKTVAQSQDMVEQRRLKVQEIRAALDQTQTEADRETKQMVKVFSDIMESVQRRLDHHLEVIKQTETKHKERAQALIQQLQQEMCELEKSSTEAQQLSLSTDPLHFLQRCPTLPPAGLKDWSSVSFEPQTYEGSAARALSELETSLSQEFNKVFKQLPKKDQLRRVQQFAVDVTLDPDTDQPHLLLAKDLKQVHCGDKCSVREKPLPLFSPSTNNRGFFSQKVLSWFLPMPRLRIHSIVTARCYEAENQLLEKVKDQSVELIPSGPADCEVVFLFCVIVFRVGTDVKAAMCRIPEAARQKPVFLMMMHHTRDKDFQTNRTEWRNIYENIDFRTEVLFQTVGGLLQCERNTRAIKEIKEKCQNYGH